MEIENQLTNSSFWKKYWKSKTKIEETIVGENYLFSDLLKTYAPPKQTAKGFSFLEIGGYPGYWSVFMTKYLDAESTLLDRYIDNDNIANLAKANGVDFINSIECDIFSHNVKTKYDVVMSAGFIEHFIDINDMIDRHLEFVKHKGMLILTVPNFLGVNGYLQKKVDYDIYAMHNLKTMSKSNMLNIMNSKQVMVKYASYYGYFGLWLEDIAHKPFWLRVAIPLLSRIGRLLVRFQSKIFSPHFVIIVEKI